MSNIGFSFMAFGFKLRDMLFPVDQFVMTLGIQQGFTIIDYGCGPGSYVNKTSPLTGITGGKNDRIETTFTAILTYG